MISWEVNLTLHYCYIINHAYLHAYLIFTNTEICMYNLAYICIFSVNKLNKHAYIVNTYMYTYIHTYIHTDIYTDKKHT